MVNRHDGDGHGQGHGVNDIIAELVYENMMLRKHNVRLLEQLERLHPTGADAVIYVQVKPGE